MSNNNILVIGIAGGTGSGKSTLTKQLVNHFGDQITVLKHDDYYKAHDEMTYEERTHLNYDHPNAFDTELMLQHLFFSGVAMGIVSEHRTNQLPDL